VLEPSVVDVASLDFPDPHVSDRLGSFALLLSALLQDLLAEHSFTVTSFSIPGVTLLEVASFCHVVHKVISWSHQLHAHVARRAALPRTNRFRFRSKMTRACRRGKSTFPGQHALQLSIYTRSENH